MNTRVITTIITAITFGVAVAQNNLNENLYVEGEYAPNIVRQDKIHQLPEKNNFSFTPETPSYALGAITGDYRTTVYALPSLNLLTSRILSPQRGYLDFSMGQYLNCEASAGYRFIDNDYMNAGAWLQHNSTSLARSCTNMFDPAQRRRMFDETVGFYASRRYKDLGSLNIEAAYHLGYFNYYGYSPAETTFSAPYHKAPTQTLNNFALNAKWNNCETGANLLYNVAAGVEYFGYRRGLMAYNLQGTMETDVHVDARIAKDFERKEIVEGEIAANWLLYAKGKGNAIYPAPLSPANYGNIAFKPHYIWKNSRLSVKAGLELDFTINAGKMKGGSIYADYENVHVAPDIRADYSAKGLGAYLAISGGTRLQTLAGGMQLDYYQLPDFFNTLPLWIPADINAGINLGKWNGFGASLHGRYAFTKNRRLDGWSMTIAGDFPSNPLCTGMEAISYMDIKGFSIGADLAYDYGHLLSAKATVEYANQNGKHGIFNGYDRPRWLMNIGIVTHPLESLDLGIDYQYRGVRKIFGYSETKGYGPKLICQKLPDLYLLNLHADWRITQMLSISCRLNNLLGQRTPFLPLQPLEGFNAMAGINLKF